MDIEKTIEMLKREIAELEARVTDLEMEADEELSTNVGECCGGCNCGGSELDED